MNFKGQLGILLIAVIILIAILATGFQEQNSAPEIVGVELEQPELSSEERYLSLQQRATHTIESLEYNVTVDDESRKILLRGRFGKVILPELHMGKYDWVYFDRVSKTALGRCSTDFCEHNLEFFPVAYADYYSSSPIETQYYFINPEYVGNEMLGSHSVEVFDMTTLDGGSGKLWIQEYYGIPMQFEVDGVLLAIEDIHVNSVNLGQVMLPMNVSVEEKVYTFGWHSYLYEEHGQVLN